jgi:hypothetical protein
MLSQLDRPEVISEVGPGKPLPGEQSPCGPAMFRFVPRWSGSFEEYLSALQPSPESGLPLCGEGAATRHTDFAGFLACDPFPRSIDSSLLGLAILSKLRYSTIDNRGWPLYNYNGLNEGRTASERNTRRKSTPRNVSSQLGFLAKFPPGSPSQKTLN